MSGRGRLELTWVGKDQRPRLEPRILLEDPAQSYRGAKAGVTDNLLIHGDNLLALKALEAEYAGKVKCIYIDPPYNTDATGVRYEDCIEHSVWLTLMRDRLEMLWALLSQDNGVILISINDDEVHYLKVLCDEVFGRNKFIASFVWNYEGNTDNQASIIRYHEYILAYSKTGMIDDPTVIDPSIAEDSKLRRSEIRNTVIKNGPKNPPKSVLIPAGFPASFETGVIRSAGMRWPKYDKDVRVEPE
jgi:adenine-specific DNA-methyltransferase